MQRGRIAHAAADALEASGSEGGGPSPAIPSPATILAEIDMEQGRLDEAALTLHDPAQQTSWGDGPRHAFHLAARGRLHHLRGDDEAALEELLESGRQLESLGVHNPAVLPWRSRAAIAAAGMGDRARAMTLADEEVSLARTFGAARPLGVALRAAALVGPAERAPGAASRGGRLPGALTRGARPGARADRSRRGAAPAAASAARPASASAPAWTWPSAARPRRSRRARARS